MLRIDRINVFYGDVQVLWDVSLKVNEEEIVTVVGPNGAGKSTLLMAVINLIHPKREDHSERGIFLNEARIDHLSPEETVRMGITIVPEGARVFPEMRVLDNLQMGSYI